MAITETPDTLTIDDLDSLEIGDLDEMGLELESVGTGGGAGYALARSRRAAMARLLAMRSVTRPLLGARS